MTAEPQRQWSVEEYLDFERQDSDRHEYLDGHILAMGGASRIHNRISWNITVALDSQLEAQGCEGFASDMRVHIHSTQRYTYPDIVVVCGKPEFEDAELDTLLNPTLILEILSSSTEDHDRGRKLFDCRSIPSVQAILLVAQNKAHVEQLARQGDGSWVLTEADALDAVVQLHGIEAQLALADIYRRVPV